MSSYEEHCFECRSDHCVCDDGYHQEEEEHEQICGYGHLFYGTHCDECVYGSDSDRELVNDSDEDSEGEIRPSTIVMLGSYDLSKYYVDDETAEVS